MVIDDETNKRLRWMVHKRVLTVMIVTYFAQTLDKGYVRFIVVPTSVNSKCFLLEPLISHQSWASFRTTISTVSSMLG